MFRLVLLMYLGNRLFFRNRIFACFVLRLAFEIVLIRRFFPPNKCSAATFTGNAVDKNLTAVCSGNLSAHIFFRTISCIFRQGFTSGTVAGHFLSPSAN